MRPTGRRMGPWSGRLPPDAGRGGMSDHARGLDEDWLDELPVDPDIDGPDDSGRRAGESPLASGRRHRPRVHLDVLGAVFLGGCFGGSARYAATLAWQAPRDALPVATLAVNLTGAFVLAVVVVVAIEIRPSRYLRPLLGTGFCGALTTFSSVVVELAQLIARQRYALAGAYLAATVVGGLAAAALGLVLSRAVATRRHLLRQERST